MKTDLVALNKYLFEELERLNDDESIKEETNFDREIKRSKAIANIAQEIVNNANTVLSAVKISNEYALEKDENINRLLDSGNKTK